MENAADALQMAAAVLIFVLALTIAINSFGQAREVAQVVLDYNDREYESTYVENNGSTRRIVGLESIIPSIFKAYRENYRIVFENMPSDFYLYEMKNQDGDFEKITEIDMETGTRLGTDEQKLKFIMALLYGEKIEDYYSENFNDIYHDMELKSGIHLKKEGIYDIMKTWKFEESIGIYYQEQASGENDITTPGVGTNTVDSSVPETNMTEKRVITYTKI